MSNANSNLGFLGTYSGKLDDKNRLTIPAAWRDALTPGAQYIAFFNPQNGVIVVYPQEQYQKILAVGDDPFFQLIDPEAYDALLKIHGACVVVEPDKAGRVVWPNGNGIETLRKAGISRDVIFQGAGSTFAIVSADNRPAPDRTSPEAREFSAALKRLLEASRENARAAAGANREGGAR